MINVFLKFFKLLNFKKKVFKLLKENNFTSSIHVINPRNISSFPHDLYASIDTRMRKKATFF